MKNRIPIEEIEELIDFHQSLRDKLAADRIKCLIYWGKGYEWEVIIELHYIPPYMPNLNLIERLWCFSKKKLLSNKYYSNFTIFRDKLIIFFDKKIKKYKYELDSLISEKFKIYQRCGLRF